ncbi:MAG: hypothetical protein KGQ28_06900 [Hyphomicrobiales bacterium]|nr:hypothetical protein [Hyphomicrobiales bacterium]
MGLLRTAFWLGIVYANLPLAAGTAELARAPDAPSATAGLAGAAGREATSFCLANPADCTAFLAGLRGVDPAFLRPAPRATDTLTAADLRPSWHGKVGG